MEACGPFPFADEQPAARSTAPDTTVDDEVSAASARVPARNMLVVNTTATPTMRHDRTQLIVLLPSDRSEVLHPVTLVERLDRCRRRRAVVLAAEPGRLFEEALVPARGEERQEPARFRSGIGEGLVRVPGHHEERPCADLDRRVASLNGQLTLKHVGRLVLVMMDVRRDVAANGQHCLEE